MSLARRFAMEGRLILKKLLSVIRMMPMWIRIRQIATPIVKYLNQPIASKEVNAVWNPNRFWYLYKIELLENCWQKEAASKSQRAY